MGEITPSASRGQIAANVSQALTSRVHQIQVQNLLSNYFCCPDGKPILYTPHYILRSWRLLAREARPEFPFATLHKRACSVYNCFLLFFCSGDSKSSSTIPSFLLFFVHPPYDDGGVVISPSSSSLQPSSPIKECLYGQWRCSAHNVHAHARTYSHETRIHLYVHTYVQHDTTNTRKLRLQRLRIFLDYNTILT